MITTLFMFTTESLLWIRYTPHKTQN